MEVGGWRLEVGGICNEIRGISSHASKAPEAHLLAHVLRPAAHPTDYNHPAGAGAEHHRGNIVREDKLVIGNDGGNDTTR